MTNSVTNSVLPGGDPFATRSIAAASDGASKDMFLKLLVSQIRNQDPLNPSDGAQFVAQLAQFSQLERTITMSTDLQAIRQDLDKLTQSADGSSTAGTGQ
jgi:flagellar basal-body rod modification protein FlgD